ncbi:MAG TPA: phospholipase D-like domain-containing protein [Azospirillum sp.]|nr:phospholipase D-like domain-containing protein [Azospirillum sp.]
MRHAVALALLLISSPALTVESALPPRQIVCFTPDEDCTELVVAEIGKATASVIMQSDNHPSQPIVKALVNAKNRGIGINVIFSISQSNKHFAGLDALYNDRVDVWIDRQHAISHNNIIIVDGVTVITGSFNFTKAAQEKNAENLVVLKDAALTPRYIENWKRHVGHAEPYTPRSR